MAALAAVLILRRRFEISLGELLLFEGDLCILIKALMNPLANLFLSELGFGLGGSSSNPGRTPVRGQAAVGRGAAGEGFNAHSKEGGNHGPYEKESDDSQDNQYGNNKNKSHSFGEEVFKESNMDAEVENANVGLVFLDSKRRRVIEGQASGPKEGLDGQMRLVKSFSKMEFLEVKKGVRSWDYKRPTTI
uniref:Uncharacterized protein n=1 Tax=Cannabis sativa TaxID=3483 RepID=A0A803PFS9_CANSA